MPLIKFFMMIRWDSDKTKAVVNAIISFITALVTALTASGCMGV